MLLHSELSILSQAPRQTSLIHEQCNQAYPVMTIWSITMRAKIIPPTNGLTNAFIEHPRATTLKTLENIAFTRYSLFQATFLFFLARLREKTVPGETGSYVRWVFWGGKEFQIALSVPLHSEYQDVLTWKKHLIEANTIEDILSFLRYICSIFS